MKRQKHGWKEPERGEKCIKAKMKQESIQFDKIEALKIAT